MIDSSVGTSTANSYVSVEYADTFFASSVNSASWPTDLSKKEAALIEATRLLDQSFSWQGSIASDVQSLRWPRIDAYDVDGRLIASNVIPKAIADATCNLAYFLVQDGGLNQSSQSVSAFKIGPLDIKYSDNPSVVGVPRFVVQALNSYGSFTGYISGVVRSVKAIRC